MIFIEYSVEVLSCSLEYYINSCGLLFHVQNITNVHNTIHSFHFAIRRYFLYIFSILIACSEWLTIIFPLTEINNITRSNKRNYHFHHYTLNKNDNLDNGFNRWNSFVSIITLHIPMYIRIWGYIALLPLSPNNNKFIDTYLGANNQSSFFAIYTYIRYFIHSWGQLSLPFSIGDWNLPNMPKNIYVRILGMKMYSRDILGISG